MSVKDHDRRIKDSNGSFDVRDKAGRWLGFVPRKSVANIMAKEERPNINAIPCVDELDLWGLWVAATHGSRSTGGVEHVLQLPDDIQAVRLSDDVIMTCQKDKPEHGGGWTVKTMDIDSFAEMYVDRHELVTGTFIDKPYKPE